MRPLLPIFSALVLFATAVGAQGHPDFSGTWVMDPSRSDAAQQAVPSGPITVVIRQRAGEIQIDTTQNEITKSVSYLPFETTVLAADGTTGTFRWDGSNLITDVVMYVSGQAVTLRENRTLDAERKEMTADVSLVVEHGYRGGDYPLRSDQRPSNASKGRNVFILKP